LEESEKDTITAFVRAEKTALRLIARAEQCTKGLTRKLTKRGFDANSINEVISNLTEKNLLNDSRYARYWIQAVFALHAPQSGYCLPFARGV